MLGTSKEFSTHSPCREALISHWALGGGLAQISSHHVITLDWLMLGSEGEQWHDILLKGAFGVAFLLGTQQNLGVLQDHCWNLLSHDGWKGNLEAGGENGRFLEVPFLP